MIGIVILESVAEHARVDGRILLELLTEWNEIAKLSY